MEYIPGSIQGKNLQTIQSDLLQTLTKSQSFCKKFNWIIQFFNISLNTTKWVKIKISEFKSQYAVKFKVRTVR